MSSGTLQGYIVNTFAFGLLMVGLGKVWDILGQVVNYEISLGFQTQDGANTFSMISIVFYALGTLFLLAGGYNVIAESKKYRNRGV